MYLWNLQTGRTPCERLVLVQPSPLSVKKLNPRPRESNDLFKAVQPGSGVGTGCLWPVGDARPMGSLMYSVE